jgi:hypothetical protein
VDDDEDLREGGDSSDDDDGGDGEGGEGGDNGHGGSGSGYGIGGRSGRRAVWDGAAVTLAPALGPGDSFCTYALLRYELLRWSLIHCTDDNGKYYHKKNKNTMLLESLPSSLFLQNTKTVFFDLLSNSLSSLSLSLCLLLI